ncbi:MAG: TRAP transporter small permease [Clostridia bacterium]|nr:TRAP transporter small permease [Clostridia bacterium]MDH7573697.1 TRAP transporter small permease [Clostridia bacterium]
MRGVKAKAGSPLDVVLMIMMAVACVLLIGQDTVWLSVDVVSRWLFGKTWSGLFELTEYSLLWITFLGAGWVTRNRRHVRMDLLVSRLNPRPQKVVAAIARWATALVFGAMTVLSAWLVIHDWATGTRFTSAMQPVKWPVELVMPVGFGIMFAYECLELHRERPSPRPGQDT